MIDDLDLARLNARHPEEMQRLAHAVEEIGFLKLSNTALTGDRVRRVLAAYRDFFTLPEEDKRGVDMARTGSNRGWGAPQTEQVDPDANPDFKEVFDCGYELPDGNPYATRGLSVYAPNLWPGHPAGFRAEVQGYYTEACAVAMQVLRAIAAATGRDEHYFDTAFETPMALLRGNYYPARPDWAGDKDFGIAAHTDYGCLTLLATDGVGGLEAQMPDGTWVGVRADPGTFVINFGEMLEFWTDGQIKATPHRVRGGPEERISIPMFFNPGYDTNVAPPGSAQAISAGMHLTRRYSETYLHLNAAG
ncbi:Isopenicillin N synthase [Cribrihabitans marinus]|uniref:2-oxoglutarate-dependent ethylene/succinate-forming enzyme n=1 Tax=Cribrihabitans marinus TaxID=1227549 RepID=A0A1H6QZP7_9RHOB|nr:2-oxoglutarate and iron-dependent oxygenase domain-containing protein [Cribrihabitans marinus]GGH20220.1 oxidoreductase [Cribrihabitans marinus]SEI49109.1 Isopenicillin N synthase [Cribrihabitans marinus]